MVAHAFIDEAIRRLDVAFRVRVVSGHTNNVHCLAKAVNALAGALFTVHGPGNVEMRLKEFLAVSLTNITHCHCNLDTHQPAAVCLTCN